MAARLKLYLGPDDPQVQEILAPIYRSGLTIFFVIGSDGSVDSSESTHEFDSRSNTTHRKINVSQQLRTLGISWGNISNLIKVYPFKQLRYESESMKAAAAAKGNPKGSGSKPKIGIDGEEDELGGAEGGIDYTKKGKQRYLLIERGKYYGCFDSVDATVVLFASEREARAHIYDLLHNRDVFQSYYGGKHHRKPQELQPVD